MANTTSKLLLRASLHGFKESTYSNILKKKGSLLILVRSDKNKVFGGFAGTHFPSIAFRQNY
jgi:hypothetical protein